MLIIIHCTHYLQFSLAESLPLILEISTTYRLASYLLADNWLICRLGAQCMMSYNNINSGSLQACDCRYIFFKTMYNKTIIRFSFRVILNNRGLGKCYQPRPSAGLIMLTSTFIIPYIIRKTSLNNLLFSMEQGMVHWWEPSPSHQCGPVSNVGFNAMCGLSLLLILSFAPRD